MGPDGDYERNPQLAYARILWRLEALDEWREQVGKRLANCEKAVEGMLRVDEIAVAVRDEIKAQGPSLRLTTLQKGLAAITVLLALVGSIHGLVSGW